MLPDTLKHLRNGLQEALARSQVVIATGGLGPTCDDVTRTAAAELFGSDFYLNEELLAELKQRYGNRPISLENQATVPRKAEILPNGVGTAPGFLFKSESALLFLLPGVPHEMKKMLEEHVLPYLLKTILPTARQYVRTLHLMNLPESAVDPELRRIKEAYPMVDAGIYPSLGLVTVHLKTTASTEKEAQALLEKPFLELAERFAMNQLAPPSGTIEEAVHMKFINKGLTLSIAESCTGGAIANRLVRLPDASKYFLGSLVTYSNALKTRILGVPEQLIQDKGAVSEEVVKAMVSGLLAQTGSDYGIAVSGIAGPGGGTPEKPVGTIWAAICQNGGEPHAWMFRGFGSRDMIIERTVNAVLAQLLSEVG